MAQISWEEVRDRALSFAHEWQGEKRESAEKQTFWNEFFEVFGLRRRTVASFEVAVRNIGGHYGFIDLFWRGTLLVEHKSEGRSLEVAESEAFDYIQDLAREGRQDESPRFVIVSDFSRIALYDLEPPEGETLPLLRGRPYSSVEFSLEELARHVRRFAFLKGERTVRIDPEDPANQKAYELMCRLHDELEAGGFAGPDLEKLLVRILFCFFAEDTGIFEPNAFQAFVRQNTREDGSDLGARLNELFHVLNMPPDRRGTGLHEELAAFPYVNGELFADPLAFANFNRSMREALLLATEFQWGRVSPAVFGSLFQGVMEPQERRQSGAHYTTERDIMKVIRSLFLDEFRRDLEQLRADRSTRRRARLEDFQMELRGIRFLDPACGCGNFLVLAYRELRTLELEVLQDLSEGVPQQEMDLRALLGVNVDQFYGIDKDEWPVRISEVALWLMDHQMNQRASEVFGQFFQRLPLASTPHVVRANALRIDWNTVLPAEQCSYVLGNPPFVGHHYQTDQQKAEQAEVLRNIRGNGVLDYVTNWYVKAAEYTRGMRIPVAFVSTNSITQGEQVGILWTELFGRYRLKIHFGHRTFPWVSEARGRAHVHVVINGFGNFDVPSKRIYDYGGEDGHVVISTVANISPYLIEGPDLVVRNRTRPLSAVPKMSWGNKPTDGGNFLMTEEQRAELLAREPEVEPLIRRYMGGKDLLDDIKRYCLWLVDVDPSLLRRLPAVLARVEAVRQFRLRSSAPSTRAYATRATIFRQIAQPSSEYLAVPEASSENRRYIPMAYVSPAIICSNTLQFVANASHWHFGILTSAMHMAWVKVVCGRLRSDYRYSNTLVYNNFPWPEDASERPKALVEECARAVLDARIPYLPPSGTSNLSDIYDPLTMPPGLSQAHAELDRAVDRCYRAGAFQSDRERFEHLFAMYQRLTSPLLPEALAPRARRRVTG